MTTGRLNFLAAYPFCNPKMIDRLASLDDGVCFLLDSGAFSAFTSGTIITLDEYCRFVEQLRVRPWRYFNLDVIGDPVASDVNYRGMRARGLSPMPIFTRGGALDEIDRMYDTTDMIGVGGLIIHKTTAYRYAKAVMRHVGTRPVHLLGLTDPRWIQYLRPASCDSSSFGRATRYGQMDVYLGDGRFARYYSGTRRAETGVNNAVTSGPPSERIIRAIAGMGFDPYALQRGEEWRRGWGLARWVSAWSWVRYSQDLEAWQGTRLFLAGNDDDLAVLSACLRSQRGELDIEQARQATITRRAA